MQLGYFKEATKGGNGSSAFSLFQYTIADEGEAIGAPFSLAALGPPNYFLDGSIQVGLPVPIWEIFEGLGAVARNEKIWRRRGTQQMMGSLSRTTVCHRILP